MRKSPLLFAMSVKALSKGSVFPPITPGKLRIYSMRFCPFAHRSLLVLNAKKVPYEVVNVNLREKPDWLFEKNSLGKVPALEFDGKVLVESLIICDYLDEVYPDPKLCSTDPYEKARDRVLIEMFKRVQDKFLVLAKNLYPSKSNEDSWNEILDDLEFWDKELQKRGTEFFGGDRPGMLDYMIWPWMERLETIVVMQSVTPLSEVQKLSKLDAWMSKMTNDSVVKETNVPIPLHVEFIKAMVAGKADYDLGL